MNPESIKTVGIVSPGDMGHAIGQVLREHGLDVVVCTAGRSPRTQQLAREADLRELPSLEGLVAEADVVLSILVPAHAEQSAREIAAALTHTGQPIHYVDCNAVAPAVAARIDTLMQGQGCSFTDASIIGFPPGTASPPRLYVSGPNAAAMQQLDGMGIEVKMVGNAVGQASGIKMCYAALTKGTFALQYALAIVADQLHLLDDLLAELAVSQPNTEQQMRRFLPKLPAKAGRWIGEMEQIAATFEQAGITPKFHEGAGDIYRLISESPVGQETPETIDLSRTLEATIAILSGSLSAADSGNAKQDTG